MKTGNGLFWFRRDLRLRDNPGLAKAAAEHRHVLPVFIHDPEIKVSKRRQNAVLAVIAGLSTEMNHQLKQERGDPKEILLRLVAEHQISKVYVTAEFTPFGISRDKEISQALAAVGVDWVPIDSPYLVSPGVLKTGAGQPYRVFTPFYRSWLNAPNHN